jgi:hypothetical protein
VAAPNFAQAYKGLLSINANLFNCLVYEYQESAPLDDITYTKSGGATFAIKIPGYVSGRGSVDFAYDVANQPTVSPFLIVAGSLMTIIAMPEGTKPYSFQAYSGQFRWRSGPQATPGGASVRATVEYETTDTITRPTS